MRLEIRRNPYPWLPTVLRILLTFLCKKRISIDDQLAGTCASEHVNRPKVICTWWEGKLASNADLDQINEWPFMPTHCIFLSQIELRTSINLLSVRSCSTCYGNRARSPIFFLSTKIQFWSRLWPYFLAPFVLMKRIICIHQRLHQR